MAIPNPEGTCWFSADALDYSAAVSSTYKRGTNASHFYKNALLEVNYNEPFWQRAKRPEDYPSHPDLPELGMIGPSAQHLRSPVDRLTGRWYGHNRTDVMCYRHLVIMYGPTPQSISRTHRLTEYRNRDQWRADKGQTRVSFYPIPLPEIHDKYMWIDLTLPVRALYLPVSFEGDLEFPGLNKWIKVNFRFRTQGFNISTYDANNRFLRRVWTTQDSTNGWGRRLDDTLRVDTFALQELLVLDKWLRRTESLSMGRMIELHLYRPTASLL